MVSIHAPHEGERPKFDKSNYSKAKFQSTLPTRGSDFAENVFVVSYACFNPRSPRGGATLFAVACAKVDAFQSTLPTRGSDGTKTVVKCKKGTFQSTLPTRGSD